MTSLPRSIALIFAVAVVVNYPWELAQATLYTWPGESLNPWWHCFVASLGDGFILLAIHAAGWLALHDRGWFMRPGLNGYSLMLASGAAMAIAIELVAVHVLHRWDYAPQMPLVQGLEIGIVPITQMLVLPPLIFRLAASFPRRRIAPP